MVTSGLVVRRTRDPFARSSARVPDSRRVDLAASRSQTLPPLTYRARESILVRRPCRLSRLWSTSVRDRAR